MRRPLLVGCVVGLGLLAAGDAIGVRVGLVDGLMPRSDGPWPWTASRAAGVTAYIALALDVVFGLLLSTGVADRRIARAQVVGVHRWLSPVALGLVGGHAVLLLADGFARFDLLDAVVPFIAPERPLAVGLGVLAAQGALLVHGSFALRSRLGARAWRRIHHVSFGVFLLATAHGLLAGSDTGLPWMRALYLVGTGLVAGLVAVRLRAVVASPRPPAAMRPAASPGLGRASGQGR